MVPLRFRHYPINVLELDRNFPVPEKPISETGSLVTLPSSEESANHEFRGGRGRGCNFGLSEVEDGYGKRRRHGL